MGTVEVRDKFKDDVERFLIGVSNENLDHSYEQLVTILYAYRGLLSKDEISIVFSDIDREVELNKWQEEVIWEISNRLGGHCSPGKEIFL